MSESPDMTPDAHAPNDDDLKALLAKRQHAKPNRWTWILLGLIAVALGFAMGACAQRQLTAIVDQAGSGTAAAEVASAPADPAAHSSDSDPVGSFAP
jgi:hypothetical protein